MLFETGYAKWPPHIGTFVVGVTPWYARLFETLAPDVKTRLICFSDDMDTPKVPENVPNADMLAAHLEKPLPVCLTHLKHMIVLALIIMPAYRRFWTDLNLTMNSPVPLIIILLGRMDETF